MSLNFLHIISQLLFPILDPYSSAYSILLRIRCSVFIKRKHILCFNYIGKIKHFSKHLAKKKSNYNPTMLNLLFQLFDFIINTNCFNHTSFTILCLQIVWKFPQHLRVLIFWREMCFSNWRRNLTSAPYLPSVPLSARMKCVWELLRTESLLRGFDIVW